MFCRGANEIMNYLTRVFLNKFLLICCLLKALRTTFNQQLSTQVYFASGRKTAVIVFFLLKIRLLVVFKSLGVKA